MFGLVPAGTGLAFPATAGHYTQSFGPGITAQAQVAVMHSAFRGEGEAPRLALPSRRPTAGIE